LNIADLFFSKMFGDILRPHWSDQERDSQYKRDIGALWFSIESKENGELKFVDFPRFSQLVFEHRQAHGDSGQYFPRLVSFIGTTGAGKSTLIRALMERPWKTRDTQRNDVQNLVVPVVGRHDSTIPTSGDVHPYRDTLAEGEDISRPILYADCEGFQGGEQLPAALLARRNASRLSEESSDSHRSGISSLARISYAYIKSGVKRVLHMPTRVTDPTRGSAVLELFPRLLYNFSDVVVHVISQSVSRTLEKDIIRLLNWAKTSGASAINRATLPHLIIVINNCTEGSQWDTDQATTAIFDKQKRLLEENATVRKYKRRFERLGATITSVEDLLRCFYSTTRFVKLPDRQNLALLSAQLRQLHSIINKASLSTQITKNRAKILLTSQDQQLFYKLAFQHYSTDLDKPFDFLEKLLSLHPLPNNISNNFAALLVATNNALGNSLSAEQFCAEVAPVLCSAICHAKTPVKLQPVVR
jgi:hypothetical protein